MRIKACVWNAGLFYWDERIERVFSHLKTKAAAALGRKGERKAEAFLKAKGFETIVRNFRCKTGEIDLVMQDADGTVVFVEVKTRRSEDFTTAEDLIARAKQQRLKRASHYFLSSYPTTQQRPLRFDVVVVIAGKDDEMRHYQAAFR